MKDYKAEIKYLVEEARLTNPEYDGVLKITDKILSLFREIVQEAMPKEMVPNVKCDIPTLDKCAGFNRCRSEILSNVEKLIEH